MYKFSDRRTAVAYIKGGSGFPELVGRVNFYQKRRGVLVVADILNLPQDNGSGFFGFHIHEGDDCSGEGFSNTGKHYNPSGTQHPMHSGDLPPLIMCGGGAYMAVMTDRFSVDEIIGRTVVIHGGADDFKSQPAGNAGDKIACGIIR